MVATHSAALFETLPPEARVLLARTKNGVTSVPKAPAIAAARALSGIARTNKDLVLVEDAVGQSFLCEILRRHAKDLLSNCSVVPVGNTDDVYRMVARFRSEGVRAVGVRDPDIGDAPADGIFSMPGDIAPETLLLADQNIEAAEKLLNGISEAFERAKLTGLKLTGSKWSKQVFVALTLEMHIDPDVLSDRLTLAWLGNHDDEAKLLANALRNALQ